MCRKISSITLGDMHHWALRADCSSNLIKITHAVARSCRRRRFAVIERDHLGAGFRVNDDKIRELTGAVVLYDDGRPGR